MLKDDLEMLIGPYIYSSPSIYNKKQMEVIAQVIVDRLEIDEDKLKDFIFDYAYKHPTEMAYCINDSEFVKKIAKIKPIKIKEGRK